MPLQLHTLVIETGDGYAVRLAKQSTVRQAMRPNPVMGAYTGNRNDRAGPAAAAIVDTGLGAGCTGWRATRYWRMPVVDCVQKREVNVHGHTHGMRQDAAPSGQADAATVCQAQSITSNSGGLVRPPALAFAI